MTYCLAIKVNEGLVLAGDRRTSAGVDDVRTYNKVHTFEFPGDRVFVVLTAGNLATTQSILTLIQDDLENPDAEENLLSVRHMFDAAEYLGRKSVQAQRLVPGRDEENEKSLKTTLLLGGQIGREDPAIYLIYPIGNCIAPAPETPFLQIGESKYGKPILDRIIKPEVNLGDATRCALVSLESTMRSNVSVGPPLDVVVYRKNSLVLDHHMKFDYSDPFYNDLQSAWTHQLENAFQALPRFYWENVEDQEVQLQQQQQAQQ